MILYYFAAAAGLCRVLCSFFVPLGRQQLPIQYNTISNDNNTKYNIRATAAAVRIKTRVIYYYCCCFVCVCITHDRCTSFLDKPARIRYTFINDPQLAPQR